ncbi:MAG: patatin-like phospholipase family protein, partial [Gimesia sp.]|nr:patatin-like phospholipase family protein [Gimesia sp.]
MMSRVGLALSGGGFRATLYHLGVIRYLRDAGTLKSISQITSVSGGSILAAHLLLNWDRYCGTDAEFELAADEIIQFTKMDVRNRIVRRFPFSSTANSI